MFEDQTRPLDDVSVMIVALEDRRDEANASTASCFKELLQDQKNLVAAPNNVIVSLALAVAIAKDCDANAAKCEEIDFIVVQHVGFTNTKMARLNVKGVKVSKERKGNEAKAKQLLLEV